jgi:hypothetical protein
VLGLTSQAMVFRPLRGLITELSFAAHDNPPQRTRAEVTGPCKLRPRPPAVRRRDSTHGDPFREAIARQQLQSSMKRELLGMA